MEARTGDYVKPDGWRFGDVLTACEWDGAAFRVQTSSGPKLAVNVKITGRTLKLVNGGRAIRAKIEFVGDGEPSEFSGGWLYPMYSPR